MKDWMKEIIDEFLKKFKYTNTFENENFIYWTEGKFYYDHQSVTRDEFDLIKRYAAHNGTLPCMDREERMLDKTLSEDSREHYVENIRLRNGTYSHETFLRYSKKYDQLEYYNFRINVRASARRKSKRVYVMSQKSTILTVNNKGYVRFGGKRWLSLKNWNRFNMTTSSLGEDLAKLLLKSMIGKDWVSTLDIEESLMISNKNSRKANSLDEAIELECGAKPIKFISNLFGNDINSMINLYKLIEPNKIHYITNFIQKNRVNFERIISSYKNNYGSNISSNRILCYYFLCKDNRCEIGIVEDYLKMLLESGQKINLNISSYSTIKARHDELSRLSLIKSLGKGGNLGVKKIYPNIKSFPGLGVEKIKTIARLNQESAILHHCVHSYKQQISSGQCAIYSLLYDGNSYTLQISSVLRGEKENGEKEYDFKLAQLKGKYNCNPPESMKLLLDKMCVDNSLLPLSNSSIYFNRDGNNGARVFDREIIQIGDKILDRIDGYGNIKLLYKDEEPKEVGLAPAHQGVPVFENDIPF